jgi:hypothetical protein
VTASNPEQPDRDMNLSDFGKLMAAFAKGYKHVQVAVFFDSLGETIDYLSYVDPFIARLAAAHHGLIFESAAARLKWLQLGDIKTLEISAGDLDSLTVKVEEDVYLTVMADHGTIDDKMCQSVFDLAEKLRQEAGY